MATVTPGQAATPQPSPVEMISALLDAEKVTPAPTPESEAQPEAEAEEAGSNNAQVEGEDASQAAGEQEPEKAAVAEIPLDQLEAIELEVELAGETGKVVEKKSIKELKLGYMRQQDYSRKTAEVARQREEVGKNVRQAVESERTQYAQNLQELQAALIDSVAPELKNADWNALATNDPFEYVRLRNRAEQIQNALNGIKAKQQELQAKVERERTEAREIQAQKTWSTLEADIPGWNAEVYQAALEASEALGFTKAETGGWLDPRAIKLLHKAHLYDQLKAGKPPAEKKVVVAPKAIAPGAPATVSKPAQQRQAALERLRKSGKLEDAVAVIATQL